MWRQGVGVAEGVVENGMVRNTTTYFVISLLLLAFACGDNSTSKLPSPDFTYKIEGPYVTFTNTSKQATSYKWDFGDGEASSEKDPKHTYGAKGNYKVSMTATNSFGSDSANKVLTIGAVYIPITGVTVDPDTLRLKAKGALGALRHSVELMVVLDPPKATNSKEVTWSSNNLAVATVDRATGEVQGLVVGKATITAEVTTDGGDTFTGTSEVSVVVPVTTVTANPPTLRLTVGEVDQLTALIQPDNATNKRVTWASGDSDIASVNENTGQVHGERVGVTRITATSDDGGITGTTEVTVDP